METFKPNNHGVLRYAKPITKETLETVVSDFYDALEDFPEPIYRWLDERLPHEQPGPNTWTVDLANDQETAFMFNLTGLTADEKDELTNELDGVIADSDRQNLTFGGEARFNLTYYIVARFAQRSYGVITHITYHVYWEVAE
jgi:hypothetical protein